MPCGSQSLKGAVKGFLLKAKGQFSKFQSSINLIAIRFLLIFVFSLELSLLVNRERKFVTR